MNKNYPLSLFLALALLLLGNKSKAQVEDPLTFNLSLNHDAFFGFNPMLSGAYSFNEKVALTFYGIQWGAGTASAWGNWTEFGLGANFTAGDFDINPQLGFTMGNLLSSSAVNRGVVGDGIVPNLTINYGSERFEGQIYAGYYGALRNTTVADAEPMQSTSNYIHYWANAGVKATSWFSLGAHFEQLYFDGGSNAEAADTYQWLGPYAQFSKGRAGMRFSAGANLVQERKDDGGNDFYKLSFFFGF